MEAVTGYFKPACGPHGRTIIQQHRLLTNLSQAQELSTLSDRRRTFPTPWPLKNQNPQQHAVDTCHSPRLRKPCMLGTAQGSFGGPFECSCTWSIRRRTSVIVCKARYFDCQGSPEVEAMWGTVCRGYIHNKGTFDMPSTTSAACVEKSNPCLHWSARDTMYTLTPARAWFPRSNKERKCLCGGVTAPVRL